MTIQTVLMDLYDALSKPALRTIGRAPQRSWWRDDVKITQLEVSIDERLARLEKDLRWLKWGVMAVFLLLSGGGVMTAFLLLGGEFFKAVFGADTQTLSATLRARPVTVARAHISGAASAGRVKMASSQSMLDGVSQQMSRHCCPLWLTATK